MTAQKILTELTLTTQQAINAWVVICLVLGVLIGLLAVSVVTEWLMDRYVARYFAEKHPVIEDVTERRKWNAVMATRGQR